jgi:hypothetical protein
MPTEPLTTSHRGGHAAGFARRIRGLSDRAIAWIFVAPTIFLLLAVNIFPLIWTISLILDQLPDEPTKQPCEVRRDRELSQDPD